MSEAARPGEDAFQSAVVAAYEAREPLLIRGGNTKAAMLRPVQAARTLSIESHTGVTLYSPKELVFAARAGTTMADVDAALAASGQHMIAEPPDYSRLLGADLVRGKRWAAWCRRICRGRGASRGVRCAITCWACAR